MGSQPIAPGGWYCGYDTPNFFGFSEVAGWLRGIPGEQKAIQVQGNNDMNATTAGIYVYAGEDRQRQVCEAIGGFDGGGPETLDTGNTRLVLEREPDDANWKYLYINVEPSQGVSPERAGS